LNAERALSAFSFLAGIPKDLNLSRAAASRPPESDPQQ
jgi:hypothetical protein